MTAFVTEMMADVGKQSDGNIASAVACNIPVEDHHLLHLPAHA